MQSMSQQATLTFDMLESDDVGMYTCTTTFGSPYLVGTRTLTSTVSVICKFVEFHHDH